MQRVLRGWMLGVFGLGCVIVRPGLAGVTTSGNTFDDGFAFYAGYDVNTAGSLRIDAGSGINRYMGYLGYAAGSTGTATVTGARSSWGDLGGSLYIGQAGTGILSLEAGGRVSDASAYVGNYAGSSGAVTVNGAGSMWTNSGSLYVGWDGNGTLTVSDGGLVSASTLYASLSDLRGNGTITVQSAAVLDADLLFDAAHGTVQTLAFGSGGTLQLTLRSTGVLGVGYKQSGSLRIAEGNEISLPTCYLGYRSGSTGTATVTGVGSKWTSPILYVGNSGNGLLRVEAGGQISFGDGFLGYNSGSTGTATITGAGSKWTNSTPYIGFSGGGALNVEAGGEVRSVGGVLGYNPGSTGAATIAGAGSMWTNSSGLLVGNHGGGSLIVQDGGQVNSLAGSLGVEPDSTGAATVSGMGRSGPTLMNSWWAGVAAAR